MGISIGVHQGLLKEETKRMTKTNRRNKLPSNPIKATRRKINKPPNMRN